MLMACNDDIYLSSDSAVGHAMRFEVTVEDQPQTRGEVLNVNDNEVTRDFKKGDSFGLFIIDGEGNFVSQIDGTNAKNLKLTTPDGKAWNLESDITEVVHKLGYRYMAYFPYSEAFNNCASTADIQKLLTAPADDQSAQAAIDWMYTEVTPPQTNAVTILTFKHRYAKIDIYHSFTQDHTCNWASMYKFTKTVDENKVEHYRYILNSPSLQTLSINGKYTIGNYLTGIKEFSYECPNIAIENGRHAIVYTYRMDERCAIDLGFPSGVRWSPINLGAETSYCMADSYLDDSEISAALNKFGKRLAWGELFEKDSYNYDTYINDPYNKNGFSLLPKDISETVYDPAKQYWGGHWSLPNNDDIQEFIDNMEIVSSEKITSAEIGKDVFRITLRSKKNGKEITMLTNGVASNSGIINNQYMHYMSANISGYANCYYLLYNNNSLQKASTYRYYGFSIRPVLKELYIYPDDKKKDIVVRHIDDLAVDLDITKTVTETINGVEQQVTYKLLWSPFNYGVESKVDLKTYNGAPIDENLYIEQCKKSIGMRFAWGDTKEPAYFNKIEYANSAIAKEYDWYSTSTDLDRRDLKAKDDIVQLNWPKGWYIPTAKDYKLLADNVTITYTKDNDNRTWFCLTGKNGNSIMIPATLYLDGNGNTKTPNKETTTSYTEVYLQSVTIGTKGNEPKQYALHINTSGVKEVVNTAGRATGLMCRPVKYVRVQ